MKFSISWLKTYLQYNENIDVVLDCLNDLGLEVESVEDPTNTVSYTHLTLTTIYSE